MHKDEYTVRICLREMASTTMGYVFIATAPGPKTFGIKVTVENGNMLLLSGECQKEEESTYDIERSALKFMSKLTPLRSDADLEHISVACHDGVLIVIVPKVGATMNLPDSIMEKIFVHVNNFSSCILVCKQWKRAISSPSFAFLHTSFYKDRTWFAILSSPQDQCMLLYDTATSGTITKRLLQSAESVTSQPAAGGPTIRHYYGGRFEETFVPKDQDVEQLLATASGLILSKSTSGSLSITNIITRNKKLLPSPAASFVGAHIALVGMAYMWQNSSYKVLLSWAEAKGVLATHIFSSQTWQWRCASSALTTDSFIGDSNHLTELDPWGLQVSIKDQFRLPRTCIWLEGRFYCVLDRVVRYFDSVSMDWYKLNSGQPHHHTAQDVVLPSEMTHLFGVWGKDGHIIVAGSARDINARNGTHVWRLTPAIIESTPDGFLWQHVAHVPLPYFESDEGLRMPGRLCGKQGFGRGDNLCLTTVDKDEYEALDSACNVYHHVYNLADNTLTAEYRTRFSRFFDKYIPANLGIQPCPFTSP